MDAAPMGHVYVNVIGNALTYGAVSEDLRVWIEAFALPNRSGWRSQAQDMIPPSMT